MILSPGAMLRRHSAARCTSEAGGPPSAHVAACTAATQVVGLVAFTRRYSTSTPAEAFHHRRASASPPGAPAASALQNTLCRGGSYRLAPQACGATTVSLSFDQACDHLVFDLNDTPDLRPPYLSLIFLTVLIARSPGR
jgi:hypothetical protein